MKFISPTVIVMADVMRDGGSYLLVYRGTEGRSYTVYLPVVTVEDQVAGYLPPSVRDQQSDESQSLSWHDASALAEQLLPLLSPSIAEGGQVRAAECIALLASGGDAKCLPPAPMARLW
jgi:hypothetical protein